MDKTLHLLIMYTMLVLMVILLRKGNKDKRRLYLAAYALIEVITNGIDSILLWGGANIYDTFPAIQFMSKPVTLLWVPLFYFYINSCFSSEFVFKRKHLLHLLPFIMVFSFYMVLHIIKGGEAIAANMFHFGTIEGNSLYIIDIMLRLQYLVYNIYFIIRLSKVEHLLKQKESIADLNVNIKWLRFIVYGYAIACLGAIITFVFFHINFKIAGKINVYSILYFFLFFFVIFYDTISSNSFSSVIKYKQIPVSNEELIKIIEDLKMLLNNDPLYLDANINLKQIAGALNIKDRIISQAINTIENRNFKDFINELRIKHAIELLKSNKDKPIFEVMFESGFNTKAPFNSAFKKFIGKTPSEYRISLD